MIILFFAGNNVFYKNLHVKVLDIFGPTIHKWWNAKNDNLKDDLMNHMVNLFGDTLNQKGVTVAAGLNLKYVRANYRDNLQINPKIERPLMIPKEWKALMDDAKEKALRKRGKTRPLGSRRYDTSYFQ